MRCLVVASFMSSSAPTQAAQLSLLLAFLLALAHAGPRVRSRTLALVVAMSVASHSLGEAALFAAALGLAVPLLLFFQSRGRTMNGHAAAVHDAELNKSQSPAPVPARADRADRNHAPAPAPAPAAPRPPRHPAYPDPTCFDDDFLRRLRLAAERAASATAQPKPAPSAPWPKDWPVYWEGGGPAGLGRWA